MRTRSVRPGLAAGGRSKACAEAGPVSDSVSAWPMATGTARALALADQSADQSKGCPGWSFSQAACLSASGFFAGSSQAFTDCLAAASATGWLKVTVSARWGSWVASSVMIFTATSAVRL